MSPTSSALVVSLSLFLLGTGPSAGATPDPSATNPASDTRILASSSPGDSMAQEEKRRVPKDRADPRKRERGGTEEREGKSEQKDEDEKKGGGFTDCILDVLLSIVSSSSHGRDDVVVDPPDRGPEPPPLSVNPWPTGVQAMVMPADSSAQGVMVWNEAGGEEAGGDVVTHLPIGTDVAVRNSRWLASGPWVEVAVGDGAQPTGWVLGADLVARRSEELPPLPGSVPASSSDRETPLPVGVAADISVFDAGPEDVSDEYVKAPWRLGLRLSWPPASTWQAGFALGYSQVRGTPQTYYQIPYETPRQIDYPYDSRLQIVDVGVDAGQSLGLGRNWGFSWAVGPTLNWLQESANVEYDLLQGGAVVDFGRRREVLVRWRAGGDAKLWFGMRRDSGLRLGLALRAFVIPWHSEGLKSLTLDFIGDRSIAGGSVGFYIGI
jgi:hypothetical protein